MMTPNEMIKQVTEHTDRYLAVLDTLDMRQLTWKASDDDWSLGQMYLHLIHAALYMQLANVEACLSASEETASVQNGKTEVGEKVFTQGSIPPIRIHVPASPQYTPPQPESREQIIGGFQAVLQRLKETAPRLEASTFRHHVQHPGFGALNAKEWFALVEMHYRHHFMQLDRLKNALADYYTTT
ncbi:DinB family protein [Brevibacillus panacihumi]|uniref:DinB family protein n=1 Tax=Brevibacillus panacihumi TaxID=497735 RepID=UPI003D23C673